jgi:hypothetical protein
MTHLDVFLRCYPPTASHHRKVISRFRKKGGGDVAGLRDADSLVESKRFLHDLLAPHVAAWGRPPLTVPLACILEFEWPWTTDHKAAHRAQGRVPRTTRPDSLNVGKTLEDVIVNAGFVADDNLHVFNVVSRWYGATPGIRIRLIDWSDVALFVREEDTWTPLI